MVFAQQYIYMNWNQIWWSDPWADGKATVGTIVISFIEKN